MCRYGFHTYKNHYLCFNCRKQFKQLTFAEKIGDKYDTFKRLDDIANGIYKLSKWHEKYKKGEVIELTDEEKLEYKQLKDRYLQLIVCPQCRMPMMETGKDTKAPKMKDFEAWKALESTHKFGYTFGSCGCGGPGFIPKNKKEYKEFLEKRISDYTENYENANIAFRKNIDFITHEQDMFYWANKIKAIKQIIEKI